MNKGLTQPSRKHQHTINKTQQTHNKINQQTIEQISTNDQQHIYKKLQ